MINIRRPLHVFLCHASNDKSVVRRLYEHLVGDGIDAWLDREKLIPGQDWQSEITKAVKDSDVVVVCLSSQSITKEGYVQREIKFALDRADEKPEGTIFIIPARLEDCDVPVRLSKFQWVDLFLDDGYEWLIKALRMRAASLGASIKPEKATVITEQDAPDTPKISVDISERLVDVIKSIDGKLRPRPGFSWLSNLAHDFRVRWKSRKRHPDYPNVVASDNEGSWIPAPGYKFLNDISDDFRVQWQPGKEHLDYPNAIASDEEGIWIPSLGYKFINDIAGDFRVRWQPGKKRRDFPNVIASDEEGKWIPAPGYKFINDISDDLRVQWQPRIEHPDYLNVIASDEEGKWIPASGYTWANAQSNDLRVVRSNRT